MERKLATIRKIREILPIENADFIELVKIDGWQCVAKRGEFKVGDLCMYCEVDSVLPVRPEFEFLRKSCYKKMWDGTEGFRIRTQKMRGVLSQGIAFPLSILGYKMAELLKDTIPEGEQVSIAVDHKEGDDVTEFLGIKKFEQYTPAQLMGEIKGPFPSHIFPRSDEERAQNIPWVLEKYKDTLFYVSEKLNGCLHESVEIETNDGIKAISEICVNKLKVKIKSYDIENNHIVWDDIYNYSIRDDDGNWYELELENGKKIVLTGDHRVWIPKLNCYRKVNELKGNEEFLVD